MKILVTGAGGLLGRVLAPMLAERHEVVLADVADPDMGPPCRVGDLRDAGFAAEAAAGVDAIVHPAALHGATWARAGDEGGFDVNVRGTYNVLAAAVAAGVKRVVFTSSIWATGHAPQPTPYLPIDEDLDREPAEVYGLTKKLGEAMCSYTTMQHGVSTICLRPGGIMPADAPPERRFGLLYGGVDVRDVALAHVLAVELPPGVAHEVCIVTADSPLADVDPSEYAADPVEVLDMFYPGVRERIEAGQYSLPARPEWYSIEHARETLGYYPRHNFELPG